MARFGDADFSRGVPEGFSGFVGGSSLFPATFILCTLLLEALRVPRGSMGEAFFEAKGRAEALVGCSASGVHNGGGGRPARPGASQTRTLLGPLGGCSGRCRSGLCVDGRVETLAFCGQFGLDFLLAHAKRAHRVALLQQLQLHATLLLMHGEGRVHATLRRAPPALFVTRAAASCSALLAPPQRGGLAHVAEIPLHVAARRAAAHLPKTHSVVHGRE
jgi:hypothetical protein